MAQTNIENNLVLLSYSTNLTVPDWKVVGCAVDNELDTSIDVAITKTKTCGELVTPGTPSNGFSGSYVANATPAAGEGSVDEVQAIAQARTLALWKLEDSVDPTRYHRSARGYVTSINEQAPEGGHLAFDIEIKLTGDLDITSA